MKVTYMVERSVEGWNVFEDCRPLLRASGRNNAIQLAYLMLVATKAAGGAADLFVRDSAGFLQDCGDDPDFARILAADPEDAGQSSPRA